MTMALALPDLAAMDALGQRIAEKCYCTGQNNTVRWRPYRDEYTGSLPNSEVNRCRARSVLGWGTAWEALRVLLAF